MHVPEVALQTVGLKPARTSDTLVQNLFEAHREVFSFP